MLKNVLFSHNDLDGVGCAILLRTFLDFKSEDIYFTTHGVDNRIDKDIQKNLSKYDLKDCNVFLTDISPDKEDTLVWLIKSCKSVRVFDHHKSKDYYSKYKEFTFDNEKSATLIIKNYIENIGKWNDICINDWNYFVETVNDFDLYLLKNSFSKDLNNLFHFMGLNKFLDVFTYRPYMMYRYNDIVDILKVSERKYIDKVMLSKLPTACGGEYVFCELYSNEVANEIAKNNDAKIGIVINMKNKSVSLRSIGDVDVSSIAEDNGGGGHRNASGFTFITLNEINDFIKTGKKIL